MRKQIGNALERFGEQAVKEILAEAEVLASKGKLKHRGRYLSTALREGYGAKTEEERGQEKAQAEAAKKRQQAADEHARLQERLKEVESGYARYLQEEGKERFLRQDEECRSEVEGAFQRSVLVSKAMKDEWKAEGSAYSEQLSPRMKMLFLWMGKVV